jgi:hypothetical protein
MAHNDHEHESPHGRTVRDDQTAAAYRFGFSAGRERRHAAFDEAEGELKARWSRAGLDAGSWEKHRDLIREGFACAREGPEDTPVEAEHGGPGIEPLSADPATEKANRAHDHVAHRGRRA